MTAGFGYALWQKRTGVVAMMLLVAALLSLADALVGGFRGERGSIPLIPGSRFLISGPLPPRTEAIKDFVIEGQPEDGSVRLVPETLFAGYWFGGSMWRGAIVVDAQAQEGRYVISVKDAYGEKQNPALVFNVRLWPDEATRNANSPSRLTRLTGKSPFVIAFALALGGMVAIGVHFVCGRLWARHLHAHHCGEIYKLRQTDRGTEVTCELRCGGMVRPGMEGAIYTAAGELVSAGTVASCLKGEVLMLVRSPNRVRLGDVACVQVAPAPALADDGRSAV